MIVQHKSWSQSNAASKTLKFENYDKDLTEIPKKEE